MVLDLDAYKQGVEILTQFEYDSDEYLRLINIEYYDKQKEIVIISSNKGNTVMLNSKILYVEYDCDKKEIIELQDFTPNSYKIKRTLTQQMELLVYDLNNPKPAKPIC